MSIPVELADLPATLAAYPWGYVVTVSADLRAHVLAVPTEWVDGAIHLHTGRTTRQNAAARPEVTMVCPSPEPGAFSLVIDGVAHVHDDVVTLVPTWAVLHRPAIAAP